MSEEQEVQEQEANPYNRKKAWHTPDAPNRGNADGLFFEEDAQATSSDEAPETTSTSKSRTNYKKRYDDLKKHYDQKISAFKQRELELQAAAAGEQANKAPPKTAEDLASFRQEYPDLYDTVETVAQMQTQSQTESLQAKLDALQERENSIARKEAEEALRSNHPDFEDIRGDEQFHEWAKTQPDQIQDWIYNNPDNVTLAIKAIDLYKLENGQATSKPKTRKSQSTGSAADMVSTKTKSVDAKEPRIWSRKEISSLSMDDYDRFEQEIDLAVREGRVTS